MVSQRLLQVSRGLRRNGNKRNVSTIHGGMMTGLVNRGSAVRVCYPASASQQGLQGISATDISPQPSKNPVPACELAAAAAAYAVGDNAAGERHFTAGWREHQTMAQGVARRILRDPTLTDDAMQIASIKVWRSVKSGYAPTHGWRVIVKTAAHHAAVQLLDRHIRYRADEVGSFDNPDLTDQAQFRANELHPELDPDAAMALEGLAVEAERRGGTHGPLWAAIIRQVADGHVSREVIAANLGKPAGTIRREIHDMCRTNLLDSLTKQERFVDWRECEDPARLFAFEYADIERPTT